MAMCDTLCCRIKHQQEDVMEDARCKILIFGVTGVTGGSVVEACVGSCWFITSGFTRAESDDNFVTVLQEKDVKIHHGDMTNYNSVLNALEDIDTIFLTTHYWECMSVENEVLQGINVVNAAMAKGVRHLIYASTNYSPLTSDEKCRYLEGKAKIEMHIVNSGIPYTIVRLGFLYENLLGLFKPHMVGERTFAVAYPMGDKGLNMGSMLDFGQAISRIALRPKMYVFQTMQLSADYLTVDQIVDTLNNQFKGSMVFFNPNLTLTEYRGMDFEGIDELVSMWQHYRNISKWDQDDMDSLAHKHFKFDDFVRQREKIILDILTEHEDNGDLLSDMKSTCSKSEEKSTFSRLISSISTGKKQGSPDTVRQSIQDSVNSQKSSGLFYKSSMMTNTDICTSADNSPTTPKKSTFFSFWK